jgi:hypothetical protein
MTLRRNTPSAQAPEPVRHVIADYKHRAQVVTCECGWIGSSASPFGERSAWQEHLVERRPVRR